MVNSVTIGVKDRSDMQVSKRNWANAVARRLLRAPRTFSVPAGPALFPIISIRLFYVAVQIIWNILHAMSVRPVRPVRPVCPGAHPSLSCAPYDPRPGHGPHFGTSTRASQRDDKRHACAAVAHTPTSVQMPMTARP